MGIKLDIEFIESKRPVIEPVTKFGGQPVWIESPQWPISKTLGRPMQFIGQVAIHPILFKDFKAKMAYLFMADESEGQGECETWDPDGGDNAVILQPGQVKVPVEPLEEGPSLYRMVTKGLFKKKRVAEPCEYSVELKENLDPEFVSQEQQKDIDDEICEKYFMKVQGNKVGGTPCFIQNDELPFEDWRLLLQIDSTCVPFWINMGDAGMGQIFTNSNGTEAKFLWQCG